ncbi:MAG: CvpA family protein [Bacteroidota bacterium]
MHTIDLIILVVVLIGLVRGIMTGGIRQVLSFTGIFLAFIVAARTSDGLGRRIAEGIGISESLAPIVGFAVIFLIIQGLAYGLARMLEKFLETIKLGALDKILGGGIGVFKASLMVSLVLFLGGYVGIPNKETREASVFYNTVYPIMPATWEFVTGRLPKMKEAAEDAADSLIDDAKQEETEQAPPEEN